MTYSDLLFMRWFYRPEPRLPVRTFSCTHGISMRCGSKNECSALRWAEYVEGSELGAAEGVLARVLSNRIMLCKANFTTDELEAFTKGETNCKVIQES